MQLSPDKSLGTHSPCFIIAEAGVNHNGSIEQACALIDAAAAAGADAVKFQLYQVAEQVCPAATTAPYQKQQTGADTLATMAESYDLPWDAHHRLAAHCKAQGILYSASTFDPEAVDFAISLGVTFLKIASGEITNTRLIRYAAAQGLPLLLSTGMSTYEDVADAVALIRSSGNPPLALFHCISSYPTPAEQVHMRVMQELASRHGVPVGFSDHTESSIAAIVAIGMGAVMVEKHFTLDRDLPGPDHSMSQTPEQLRQYVQTIRAAEACLGSEHNIVSADELRNAQVARRSLVTARDISVGECFTEANVVFKRPGTGIDPRQWMRVEGKASARDIPADSLLAWDMIK